MADTKTATISHLLHTLNDTKTVTHKIRLTKKSANQILKKLDGKYSLESTDPRESKIRAPPQPLPYLMPIPPTRFFYNK